LYGLKHSRLRNTFYTVIFGMPNSLLALVTDLQGLTWNASRTLSKMSSDTRGRPELLPLHKHPVSTNCRYRLVTLFRVRVRVTLQLTVSQSVCLGVEPNLELLTRDIYLFIFFF
jgi:hypothetical protein